MTVTDTVNALTNNSFTSTAVAAALTAAQVIVASYVDATYVAGADEKLDLAVALACREILEQGRNSSKNKTLKDNYTSASILTQEIKDILSSYKISTVPVPVLVDTTPSLTDHWRS